MSMPKIIPVILAGGSGTRLWPVSREDVPKQFCPLGDGYSLFQKTVMRVRKSNIFGAPIVVTGERYGELAQTQLNALNCIPMAVICEPEGKDTAAAVLLAAELACLPKKALMMVMPSDHLMNNEEAFLRATEKARDSAANDGLIITFGIKPSHPETGFGYLRAGTPLFNRAVCDLDSFIEKPDLQQAEQLIQDPSVFWNAGIFMFERSTVRHEFDVHAAKVASCVRKSVLTGTWRGMKFLPEPEAFAKTPAISFDYAVMEKTQRAATIPVDPEWSDLGSWKAMWGTSKRDDNENVVGDACFIHNARDCYVHSDGPVVGVCDIEDIVVVASKDAVLVTSRENPQGVKHLVSSMKAADIPCATGHPGEDRPWGRFDSLDRGEAHQVKRIRVDPGECLSLQYHHHRAEHWIVVCGVATVTVDETVKKLSAGEQIYVPQGATHRLENTTNLPVEIIEVQIGNYLGEDDIIRVEDTYGRSPTVERHDGHAA